MPDKLVPIYDGGLGRMILEYRPVRRRRRKLRVKVMKQQQKSKVPRAAKVAALRMSNMRQKILTSTKADQPPFLPVHNPEFEKCSKAIAQLRAFTNANSRPIAKCDPTKPKSIKHLNEQVNAGKFRHFQLEKFKAAFNQRKEFFKNELARIEAEKQLVAWRKGAGGAYLATEKNLLRVKADLVECSNGNSVSLAAVKRTLPIILDRREQDGPGDTLINVLDALEGLPVFFKGNLRGSMVHSAPELRAELNDHLTTWRQEFPKL